MSALFLLRPTATPSPEVLSRLLARLRGHGVTFDALWYAASDRAHVHADALEELSSAAGERVAELATQATGPLLERLAASGRALCNPHARLGVVADEPLLSQLIAWLVLGLPQAAHRAMIAPGGVAWLEGEVAPAAMVLYAHLTPAMLGIEAGAS